MKKILILVFVFFNFNFESKCKDTSRHLVFGVLGAPASGKGFVQSKFEKNKFYLNVRKDGDDLTIDILRKNFFELPALIQLFSFFKSFSLLKRLSASSPSDYGDNFNEHKASISKYLTKALQDTVPGKKVEIVNDSLVFKIDDEEVSENYFLKAIENDAENIMDNIKKQNPYTPFIQVIRVIQFQMLLEALETGKNLFFDETGVVFPTMKRNLEKMHKSKYIVALLLIHPSDIGINFMRNARRMIIGSDNGRDSSSSIVWTYGKIEDVLRKYKKLTEDGGILDGDLKKNFYQIEEKLEEINIEDDKEKGDVPIDLLTIVSSGDVGETYRMTVQDLEKQQIQDNKVLRKLQQILVDRDTEPDQLLDSLKEVIKLEGYISYTQIFNFILFLHSKRYLENPTPYEVEGLNRDFVEVKLKKSSEAVQKAISFKKNFKKKVRDIFDKTMKLHLSFVVLREQLEKADLLNELNGVESEFNVKISVLHRLSGIKKDLKKLIDID